MLFQGFMNVLSAGGIGIPPADLRLQDFLFRNATAFLLRGCAGIRSGIMSAIADPNPAPVLRARPESSVRNCTHDAGKFPIARGSRDQKHEYCAVKKKL